MKRGDHGKSEDSIAQPASHKTGGHDNPTVGQVGSNSPQSRRGREGHQEGEGHPSSPSDGRPGPSAQTAGNHLRSRHPEGIRPEDIDNLEMQLIVAFKAAKPADAWSLTHKLLELARSLQVEAAKARFQVNFGTSMCESCEGLRAGDEVAATCFQTKRCYYDNVKKDMTPKQRGIMDSLLRQFKP